MVWPFSSAGNKKTAEAEKYDLKDQNRNEWELGAARNVFFDTPLPISLLQASLMAHFSQTSLLWLHGLYLLMFLISKHDVASASSVTQQGRVNNPHTRLQPRKLERNKGAVRMMMLSGNRIDNAAWGRCYGFHLLVKGPELIRSAEGAL